MCGHPLAGFMPAMQGRVLRTWIDRSIVGQRGGGEEAELGAVLIEGAVGDETPVRGATASRERPIRR
jgi:hypothetical protein